MITRTASARYEGLGKDGKVGGSSYDADIKYE